jgi:hypothetical protein
MKNKVNWIPVEQSLPEDKRPVLVYVSRFHSRKIRIAQYLLGEDYLEEQWFESLAVSPLIKDSVTHWAELPEAPEND